MAPRFAFLAMAALGKVVNWFEYTVLRDAYTAGRMLEFATILPIFVIAILLRQVREELRRAKTWPLPRARSTGPDRPRYPAFIWGPAAVRAGLLAPRPEPTERLITLDQQDPQPGSAVLAVDMHDALPSSTSAEWVPGF